MNFRWLIVCALAVTAVKPASAQVSVYADLSFSKLTGGLTTTTTNILPGSTIGLTAQLGSKAHLKLYADVRGELYGGAQRLDGVVIGPKLALPFKKNELYTEILVGFARYNDGLGNPASGSTDGQTEINFGLDRNISSRFDWRVFDFGYQQYYGLGGEYNPKTFSTGVVFHLSKTK